MSPVPPAVNSTNNLPSPFTVRRTRQCRVTGIVILLSGFISAAVVYWLGTRGPDYSDDPSMLGFNRAQERQMGVLYGKQGQLVEDFTNALKEPGTQAILILIVAAIIAAGCFYFARMVEDEAKEADESDIKPE